MKIKITSDKTPYTQIPNALLLDTQLSEKHRFLYCCLRSESNEWRFVAWNVMQKFGVARDGMRQGLKALRAARWLDYEMAIVGGVFKGLNVYLYNERSKSEPLRKLGNSNPAPLPYAEKFPCGENSDAGKVRIHNNKESINNHKYINNNTVASALPTLETGQLNQLTSTDERRESNASVAQHSKEKKSAAKRKDGFAVSNKAIEKLLIAEIAAQDLDADMLADAEFQSAFSNPAAQRSNQRQAYALFVYKRNSGKNMKEILKMFADQLQKYGGQKSFYWFLKNADYLTNQKPSSSSCVNPTSPSNQSDHTKVATTQQKPFKSLLQQKIEEYGTAADVQEYLAHKYNYDMYYRNASASIPEMLDKIQRKDFK